MTCLYFLPHNEEVLSDHCINAIFVLPKLQKENVVEMVPHTDKCNLLIFNVNTKDNIIKTDMLIIATIVHTPLSKALLFWLYGVEGSGDSINQTDQTDTPTSVIHLIYCNRKITK